METGGCEVAFEALREEIDMCFGTTDGSASFLERCKHPAPGKY